MMDVGRAQGTSAAVRRPKFHHVILTRFNVRFVEDPHAPSIGIDPVWLTDRFRLFERYCLPSVLAQSTQDFSWVLFLDPATPPRFTERLGELARQIPNIYPYYRATLPVHAVQQAVRSIVPVRPQWLLTTRLDNDDALHSDFVATVQSAQGFAEAEVLNCPCGIILRDDRAYRWRDRSNAFISLSEPFADFRTVLSIPRHVYAHETYTVRQVSDAPMWLQVVHEKNISNRIRGWRHPLQRALKGFPRSSASAGAKDRTSDIVIENLALSPIRWLRDLATTGARLTARQFGIELRRRARRGTGLQ